jgi:hypothetical protein
MLGFFVLNFITFLVDSNGCSNPAGGSYLCGLAELLSLILTAMWRES